MKKRIGITLAVVIVGLGLGAFLGGLKTGKKTGNNPDREAPKEEAEAGGNEEAEPAEPETEKLAEPEEEPAEPETDFSAMTPEQLDEYFCAEEISESLFQRINGKSYVQNENIAIGDLRYLSVLYYGIDGETHPGELIVNRKISDDILEIMRELYENQYPIEKMVLIDEYGADDIKSMEDNNTSAFNYRVVAGTTRLSKHALGMAIDINPRYNPYITYDEAGNSRCLPENGWEYADRSREFPYKIDKEDLCFRLFTEHGFTWGGSWRSVKDYQHFQKE